MTSKKEGRTYINMSKKVSDTLIEYGLITFSTFIIAIGVYFFKFPNNFSFGGVTGLAVVVGKVTHWSASQFTFIANTTLLIIGFLFFGRKFGLKTVYSSLLLSVALSALEKLYPLNGPITEQPFLELVFAVFLPGAGAAILFNIGASGGGTDIVAMVLKKYTRFNIGTTLFLVDLSIVVVSCFAFGPTIGLFSFVGLMTKSLVIDSVIESINLCKCFNIVCDNPDPICYFIIHKLNRSATVYHAQGAFSHHQKTVIMTTMKRGQAVILRNYIRSIDPTAFILISNSSEIIGKGFLSN